MEYASLDAQPLQIASNRHANVTVNASVILYLVERDETYVLPRAGSPTKTMAMRPEWNRRPDMVLYN
jgi:hypothetical protein